MVRFLFPLLILLTLIQISSSQLTQSETRILFQIQQVLEFPQVFQNWNNWTNFCYLPYTPHLKIVCSLNRVTELTVIGNGNGNKTQLSKNFSIDTFFTILTKLSNLKVLSLVSLGLWGTLPPKVNRFLSLEVLNISSNFINGELPSSVASFKNLRNLILSNNLFNGSVPDLTSLTLLENLDLSYNHFDSKFPSLTGTNLVSVILKNNSFRSEIPSTLKNFNRLQRFDISSNKFVGPISSSLFSLFSIQYLNLAQNKFSGSLPMNMSCNKNLTFVDISGNLFTGKLPTCIGSNSANRTVKFSWNCLASGNLKYQHTYTYCHKEALSVKPPVKGQDGKVSGIKVGLVLGIVGGIVIICVAFGLLILVLFRRSKAKRSAASTYKFDPALSSPVIDPRHVPRSMRSPALGLPPYHVYTQEEMEDATNNFDTANLINEGISQGQIYKGWLKDGTTIQVKCQKFKQKHSSQTLQDYVELISKLRHHHLISVLGHCVVTYQDHPHRASTVFVVLEHVSNGSLRDHLHDWRRKEALKWPQRMAIAIGIARGIQFLHSSVSYGIYGNNLNIENVLLDQSLTAKISCYNIPLPTKMGSESPLNAQDLGSNENAEKEDIYQLGIILLEIITGKQIQTEKELSEIKLQVEKNETGTGAKLREAVDPSIQGSYSYQSLKTAVEIAINCLSKDPIERPSIEDVLWNLQYSIQVQEGWTRSGSFNFSY